MIIFDFRIPYSRAMDSPMRKLIKTSGRIESRLNRPCIARIKQLEKQLKEVDDLVKQLYDIMFDDKK